MASTALATTLGQPGATTVAKMPGKNGKGWLRRGGSPGQRGTLAMIQGWATQDLKGALKMARDMMRDKKSPAAVRLAAAEFIRRCTGIDRAPAPARAKPPSFKVVRAPPEPAAVAIEPPAPRKGKRIQGPPSEKGLGGTRVAPPASGSDAPAT